MLVWFERAVERECSHKATDVSCNSCSVAEGAGLAVVFLPLCGMTHDRKLLLKHLHWLSAHVCVLETQEAFMCIIRDGIDVSLFLSGYICAVISPSHARQLMKVKHIVQFEYKIKKIILLFIKVAINVLKVTVTCQVTF